MFVAVASLAIALYEVRMMREHDRVSVWPYLGAFSSDSGGVYSFNVRNVGIGPALVRSFEVSVDQKPKRNWGEVVHALVASTEGTASTYSSFGRGSVLLPGSHIVLFTLGPGAAALPFHKAIQGHLDVRMCYCSLYEQCWLLDAASSEEPKLVSECPEPATPFAL